MRHFSYLKNIYCVNPYLMTVRRGAVAIPTIVLRRCNSGVTKEVRTLFSVELTVILVMNVLAPRDRIAQRAKSVAPRLMTRRLLRVFNDTSPGANDSEGCVVDPSLALSHDVGSSIQCRIRVGRQNAATDGGHGHAGHVRGSQRSLQRIRHCRRALL